MISVHMRALFFIPLTFALIFGTSYWYVTTASVCPVPILYRLGELDSRFSLSSAEARAVATAAEKTWEEAVGRDLFVYDEKAEFAINFIYDERQQLARTEEEWRLRLDAQEVESKSIIDKVKELGPVYEKAQAQYQVEREVYEGRLAEYNQKVEDLNRAGGATEPVFAELKKEQAALNTLLTRLLKAEKDLNASADTINELGEKGNAMIEKYNAEVLKYNAVYGDRDIFTQGDFERDRINIYKFSDKTELTKVIVHEFGHALGVGHVDGEESLMYYLMAEQPDDITLSAEDKVAFLSVCGDGTGFSYEARRIIRTALSYF